MCVCAKGCTSDVCPRFQDKTVPHKHAAVIKAWADGAEIERLVEQSSNGDTGNMWMPCPHPKWEQTRVYRVKPQPDPYEALKKAYAEGKIIQIAISSDGRWLDFAGVGTGKGPSWSANSIYRIKPEPKPDVIKYAAVGGNGVWHHMSGVWTNKDSVADKFYGKDSHPYKTIGKIKLTFDGETGEFKSVEKI